MVSLRKRLKSRSGNSADVLTTAGVMNGNLIVWAFREFEPLSLRHEISKGGAGSAPYQELTSFTAVSKSVISTSRRPDLREATIPSYFCSPPATPITVFALRSCSVEIPNPSRLIGLSRISPLLLSRFSRRQYQ